MSLAWRLQAWQTLRAWGESTRMQTSTLLTRVFAHTCVSLRIVHLGTYLGVHARSIDHTNNPQIYHSDTRGQEFPAGLRKHGRV